METLPEVINYDDFIGKETLNIEYKEFTFNNEGIPIDLKMAENYCSTNKFNFNINVISNLNKYFSYYIPKYICGFLNSNLYGEFYIGINDYGFIKGIPYCGDLPYDSLKQEIYRVINKFTKKSNYIFDFNKIIEINFIKINFNKTNTKSINEKFIKYLEEKKKYEEIYNSFLEEYNKWKIKFNFVTQKLIDLVNNTDSRLLLLEYIKKHDLNNPVINLLLSEDYKLEYRGHSEISTLKNDISNPYYWVTRWKDEMSLKIRSLKPIFNLEFKFKNTPINLITNSSDMIPYWMNNNDNMNLFLIQIKINKFNKYNLFSKEINNYFEYYDLYENKWTSCKRILLTNGEPVCNPY
jgi:hypothetical protein